MKIFPLKPMSAWDRMNNLMHIMETSGHVHVNPAMEHGYGVKVEPDVQHYAKLIKWNDIINKYRGKITEAVEKLRRVNNEKITRN